MSALPPTPAALPLYATVFGGGGLVAWRRRRKLLRARDLIKHPERAA